MSFVLVACLGCLFMACFITLKLVGPGLLPVTTFTAGLGFGFIIGHICHTCLFAIMKFAEAQRMRKLMIKYYDAIQELAASERGVAGQETIEHTSPSAG